MCGLGRDAARRPRHRPGYGADVMRGSVASILPDPGRVSSFRDVAIIAHRNRAEPERVGQARGRHTGGGYGVRPLARSLPEGSKWRVRAEFENWRILVWARSIDAACRCQFGCAEITVPWGPVARVPSTTERQYSR